MEHKPSICIVTFYDSGFRRIGDLAWDSMRAYAAMQGYSCMRFREPSSGRPYSWEKISCIEKALDLGYDFVLWIDADAMVVDTGQDIRSAIGEAGSAREKDFFLTRHAMGGGKSPNLGVVLVRNSEPARKILGDMWNMKKYENHRWWEQAAFLEYFGLIGGLSESERRLFDGYGDAKDIAPRADAASHIEWIDDRWNFIPGISRSVPVIKHYAGKAWFLRLDGMIFDAVQCGYLSPKDGAKYATYSLLSLWAKARLIASRLWQILRAQRRSVRARAE